LIVLGALLLANLPSATAQEPDAVRRAAGQQLEQKLALLATLQAEVDELYRATGTTPQVLLKVRILDVDHTKLGKVGFTFRTAEDMPTSKPLDFPAMLQQLTAGTHQPVTAKDAESNTMCVLPPNHAFLAFVDMLEKQQLASVVSEPNVMTYSGLPASFRSGGEFPVAAGAATTEATMKFYGTEINCLVQAQAAGRLQINFRADVSQLDPARTIHLAGQPIPGLLTSSFETTFAAQPGETFVAASMNRGRMVEVRGGKHEHHRYTRLCLVTPQFLQGTLATAEAKAAPTRR